MPKQAIYAYKNGSQSAKLLKEALGVPLLKHEGKAIAVNTVINWGSSKIADRVVANRVINPTEGVRQASNKLHAFRAFERHDVPCPLWTDDSQVAEQWVVLNGLNVFARTILNGHSGAGIVDIVKPEDFVEAPLYTQYIKRKNEYRIHIAFDKLVHVQRKARKKEVPDEEVNWKIRNHGNGFIFQIQGIEVPDRAVDVARSAVRALGLDFGAVDILEDRAGDWFVLEVNTAPGIEGTTLAKYVEAFNGL